MGNNNYYYYLLLRSIHLMMVGSANDMAVSARYLPHHYYFGYKQSLVFSNVNKTALSWGLEKIYLL